MKYCFSIFILCFPTILLASTKPPHYQELARCQPKPHVECIASFLNGYVGKNKEFFHAKFNLSSLIKVDFSGSDLSWSSFYLANLQNANLQNCQLAFTDFSYANLQRANLRGAYIEGINLKGANLKGATWINGQRCLSGSIGHCRF